MQQYVAGEQFRATALAVAELEQGSQRYTPASINLQDAVKDKDEWLVWLAVDPVFDDLKGDTRFQSIRTAIDLWQDR